MSSRKLRERVPLEDNTLSANSSDDEPAEEENETGDGDGSYENSNCDEEEDEEESEREDVDDGDDDEDYIEEDEDRNSDRKNESVIKKGRAKRKFTDTEHGDNQEDNQYWLVKPPNKNKFIEKVSFLPPDSETGEPGRLLVYPELLTRKAKQEIASSLHASGTLFVPVLPLPPHSSDKKATRQYSKEVKKRMERASTIREKYPNYSDDTAAILTDCCKAAKISVPPTLETTITKPKYRKRTWRFFGHAMHEKMHWVLYKKEVRRLFSALNKEEKKDLQFDDIENLYDKAWDTVSQKWSAKKTAEASNRSENEGKAKKKQKVSEKTKRNAKPPPKAAKKVPCRTEKSKPADSDKDRSSSSGKFDWNEISRRKAAGSSEAETDSSVARMPATAPNKKSRAKPTDSHKDRSSSGGTVDWNGVSQRKNAESSEAQTDSSVARMPAATPKKKSRTTGRDRNTTGKRASTDSSGAKSSVASAKKVTPDNNHRSSSSGQGSDGKQACDSQKPFVSAAGVKSEELTEAEEAELEELKDRIMRAGLEDYSHELVGHKYAIEILERWEHYVACCKKRHLMVDYKTLEELLSCWNH